MTPGEFLRGPEASRILHWASRAAAVPVAIHAYTATGESERIAGAGACAACRHIARHPRGLAACRQSRATAAAIALRAGLPTPFICHAGFAGFMTALTLGDTRFAVTFGPYVPAEEPRALEEDYVAALRRVAPGPVRDQAPVSLKDIAALPVSVVPAVAEQALAMLHDRWRQMAEPVPDTPADVPIPARRGRKPGGTATRLATGAYNADVIAAAAAAGHRDQARALIRAMLDESSAAKRVPVAALRARALAVTAAAIEAMGRAGHDVAALWGRMPAFLETSAQAESPLQLTAAVLETLITRKPRRQTAAATAADPLLEALQAYIAPRLMESVTLNETAAALGRNPTAITHHLQRKYGMSFSEYLGRLRVDHAKELLRRTQLGIPEISRRIGIQDPSNFGKIFKKFELSTPAQYREKFGKK